MFSRTKSQDSFPEIEKNYGVRIETYTEFDNETLELLSDSVYYEVYSKGTDELLFFIDGDYIKMEEAIIDRLKLFYFDMNDMQLFL
jgi:hypothetical protein